MSARGRTLCGMTAFGGRYLRLNFGGRGSVVAAVEKPIFRHNGSMKVLGFHLLGRGVGVVLADGRKKPSGCYLYKISLKSGIVINRWRYGFAADDFATADGKVFLVGPAGTVAVVNDRGKIIRRCPPPLLISGVAR